MSKYNARFRRKARALAAQALYQWQFNQTSIIEIESQFIEANVEQKFDLDYFRDILNGILKQLPDIDEAIVPALDRAITELTPVELAILRVAVYELKFRLDVPYKVVINEALELTKIYGTEEGYRYVNGVLDKIAPQLRKAETTP